MAGVFANLLKKNAQAGTIPTRATEARQWVGMKATSIMKQPQSVIRKSQGSQPTIGSMALFGYQATTAKTLPYWDRYPLVFPFSFTPDGMYGINLHYLPIQLRALLMDSLMETTSGSLNDEKTRLTLSYEILQGISRHQLVKPCVKYYLNRGLATPVVTIPATEWNVALFLPLERFQKASTAKVHEDSRRIIRGS